MGLFTYIVGLVYIAYLVVMTLIGYALFPIGAFSFYETIWIFAIFVLASITYLKTKKVPFPIHIQLVKKNYDVLLVFSVLLLVRLFYLQERSVWLDEDAQGTASVTNYFVGGAAGHHQPPSDFVFTRIGVLLSGFSAWGLRLHSALFSSLASASLYFFVKRYTRSLVLALGLGFLFAFHTIIVKFGFEARPISHGLFLEILFLGAFFSVLKNPDKSYLANKQWFLSVLTFLYLCSLGMQPVFVLGGALIFCFFYGLKYKNIPEKVLHPMFIGLMAYLPVQFATYKLAEARFTKVGLFDMDAFLTQLPLIHYSMVAPYIKPFLLSFAVLTALYFFAALYKKSLQIGPYFFFPFTAAFFSIVLMTYFDSHIAWFLNGYYLVSALPLAIMSLSVGFREFGQIINFKTKYILPASIVILVFCSVDYPLGPFQNLSSVYPQNDMHGAYSLITQEPKPNPVVLALCINPEKTWCAPFLVAEKYYLAQNAGAEVVLGKNSMALLLAVEDLKKMGDLYFIYYNSWSGPIPETVPVEYKVKSLFGVDVYRISGGDNVFQNMISFLKPTIDNQLKEKDRLHSYALEYVLFAYEKMGNRDMLLKYLNLFVNFKGEKVYTEYINSLLQKNGL